MFGGRFSSHIGLLGIDIGGRSIKLLQLSAQRRNRRGKQHLTANEISPTQSAEEISVTNDTLHVIGAGEVEQPQGAMHQPTGAKDQPSAAHGSSTALAAQLRATVASGRFTGRRCVVSLPRDDVHVQSVRLPKMPDAELRQAVGWEAAQRFGMTHQAMEVDFIRTGATLQSGENREEVIIIAASHEAIERRLTPVIEAGFRPVAIDTAFAALARVFSRQFRRLGDRQSVRAIVEVGATGSTVLILRGEEICFCKPLEVSGRQFNEAVAEHLDMDIQSASELRLSRMFTPSCVEESGENSEDRSTERTIYEAVRPVINELVREVNMCLRYFGVTFRGKPPTQIILTGGDGLEPRLAEHIERGCKVVVTHDDHAGTLAGLAGGIQRICHPGLSGSTYFRRSSSPGCWTVAAGLSLRGITVKEEPFLDRLRRATGLTDCQVNAPATKGAA